MRKIISKFLLLILVISPVALAALSPKIMGTPDSMRHAAQSLDQNCAQMSPPDTDPCYKCSESIRKSADIVQKYLAQQNAKDVVAEAKLKSSLGGTVISGSIAQRSQQLSTQQGNQAGLSALQEQEAVRKNVMASAEACKKDLKNGCPGKLQEQSGVKKATQACDEMGKQAAAENGQLQRAGAGANGNAGQADAQSKGMGQLGGDITKALSAIAPLAAALMKKPEENSNEKPPAQTAKVPDNTVTGDPTRTSAAPVNPVSFNRDKPTVASSEPGVHNGQKNTSGNDPIPGELSNGSGRSGGGFVGATSKTDGGGSGGGGSGNSSSGSSSHAPVGGKDKSGGAENPVEIGGGGSKGSGGSSSGSSSILGEKPMGEELAGILGDSGKNLDLENFSAPSSNPSSNSIAEAAARMEKDPSNIFAQLHARVMKRLRGGGL